MMIAVGQKDKQRRIAHVIQIIEVYIRMEFGGKSFFYFIIIFAYVPIGLSNFIKMVEETGMYAIQAIFDELPHTETEMKLEQKSTDLIFKHGATRNSF